MRKHPLLRWALRRPGLMIPVFFLSFSAGMSGQTVRMDAGASVPGGICTVEQYIPGSPVNPALLGKIKARQFSLGHARPFVLKDLGITTVSLEHQAFPGTMQWKLSGYGIKGFRQNIISMGFGMMLTENLAAGIDFRFFNVSAEGRMFYLWALAPGAGLNLRILPGLTIGILLENPVSVNNYTRYGPGMPAELSLGMSGKIYNNTTLYAEITGSTSSPPVLRLGMDILTRPTAVIRAGYQSRIHTFSLGTGLRFGQLHINLAFSWSTLPGITPSTFITHMAGP